MEIGPEPLTLHTLDTLCLLVGSLYKVMYFVKLRKEKPSWLNRLGFLSFVRVFLSMERKLGQPR